jgi:fructose-bisphosphate aldolase class II
MIVTTAELYRVAYGKFAIGAYNINNAEQTMGLFRGCIESKAPFIIQISKGARKYTDKRMLEAIIRSAAEIFPEAIFAVHLDHGDEETCYDCIDSGFYSSVMIDASHDPFEKNVEIQTCLRPRPCQGHQRRGRVGDARRRRGGHRGRGGQ